MMVFFQLVVGCETTVHRNDCVQTVKLMGDACGVHSSVWPDDFLGKVVVGFWVRDLLEAHAYGNQLVPGAEDFGLKEVGGVVGSEGLVDFELGNLRGNFDVVSM